MPTSKETQPASGFTVAQPSPKARLSVHEKIDICRGVFAILVVIAHGYEIMARLQDRDVVSLPPWVQHIIAAFPGAGIYWVMGFFVISGYCIHLSVSRLQKGDRFPLKTYIEARVTRIFPLYYAALLFAVVIEWVIAPARPHAWPDGVRGPVLISQLFCVQNLTQTYGSFAPSWSITNEFFYYLFYGLLACLLMKRREWMSGAGLVICVAVASVLQILYVGPLRSPLVYSTGMLFGLGLFWFLGAYLAQHSETIVHSRWLRIAAKGWIPLLVLGIYWKYDTRLPLQGFYVFTGLAFALMLARFLQAPEPEAGAIAPVWRTRVVEALGLLSYPMYLFHAPFMMLIASAMLRWELIPDWRVTWVLLSTCGIVFGLALAYLLEKPLMKWRAGWLKRRNGAAAITRQQVVPGTLGTAG